MSGIKSVEVAASPLEQMDKLLAEVAAAEELIAPEKGDDPVKTLEPAQIQVLFNTLRRLRSQISELRQRMYEDSLDMPIDRLCTVISSNLDGYTLREASNMAAQLYGPQLIEGLRPYDRVKVAKVVLAFFERRKIDPPLPYWGLLVANNGFVK